MKRCTESFTIWRDGAPQAFVAGQLVDDKHPILKTHKHLFDDPAATVSKGAAVQPKSVEQATSDPGEQRALTPPEQTARQEATRDTAFDPGEHTAPEVIEHLKGADEEERARVLAAEAKGKNRKGILAADLS